MDTEDKRIIEEILELNRTENERLLEMINEWKRTEEEIFDELFASFLDNEGEGEG